VLIVNEPILVSQGRNSHLRYNFLYPRWAYDAYRDLLRAHLAQREVAYIDAWNAVPQEEFTNSAVHLTPRGTRLLAGALAPALSALAKQR
jgi:lysophospholipase L1-like esterase